MTRASMSATSRTDPNTRTIDPKLTWQAGLIGLFPQASDGSKWIVHYYNKDTGYQYIVGIARKSDTPATLAGFVTTMIANNVKPMTITSDYGGEFGGPWLRAYANAGVEPAKSVAEVHVDAVEGAHRILQGHRRRQSQGVEPSGQVLTRRHDDVGDGDQFIYGVGNLSTYTHAPIRISA